MFLKLKSTLDNFLKNIKDISIVDGEMSVTKTNKTHTIELDIKNPSSVIAFFTQIQLLDNDGKPVRPSFYTDNFFSLLPGESKHISIETASEMIAQGNAKVIVKGFNSLSNISLIVKAM